jgi:hypothetical protein
VGADSRFEFDPQRLALLTAQAPAFVIIDFRCVPSYV